MPWKKVVHCTFLPHKQHWSWRLSFSAPHQKHLTILFALLQSDRKCKGRIHCHESSLHKAYQQAELLAIWVIIPRNYVSLLACQVYPTDIGFKRGEILRAIIFSRFENRGWAGAHPHDTNFYPADSLLFGFWRFLLFSISIKATATAAKGAVTQNQA